MADNGLTEERVIAAYDALDSGDRAVIERYWDSDMVWLTPGESEVSGRHVGLTGFLDFMRVMGEVTGMTMRMERLGLFVDGDTAVVLAHNAADRAGDPTRRLDIDEVHVLNWRNGKIVEGKAALFGTGTSEFGQFVA